MDKEKVYETLQTAIFEGDDELATQMAQEVVKDTSNLLEAVDVATEVIRTVGDRFGTGEIFLPEMVISAEAMQAFMKIVKPYLEETASQLRAPGKAVVGTVKGDIHSIGKSIVATMLSASGFDVIDMGVDVAPMDLIKTAEEFGANVIGLSALMTTSMPYQKEVILLLTELNQRDDFWVVIGGGPVTREYAENIGADGWAFDAGGAVRVMEKLLSSNGKSSNTEFVYQER